MLQIYRALRVLFIPVLVFTVISACDPERDSGKSELPQETRHNPYEVTLDPLFEVASISTYGKVNPKDLQAFPIQRNAIYIDESAQKPDPAADPIVYPKIGPVLERWLQEMDEEDVVDIIITFKEDLKIPLLPELQSNEKREGQNTRRAIAIAEIKRKRATSQAALLEELENYGRFQKLGSYWIVNSFLARVQIGEIKNLSKAEFVIYLQPKRGGEQPPSDLILENDVEGGRVKIVSDPYYNLGLTYPWIGILDTGVRKTHNLLSEHIDWDRDCINGGVNCNESQNAGYSTADIADHGTSTAAIISGGELLGPTYRGVTEIRTDSWRIYYLENCNSPHGCLDSDAAVRAIEAGTAAYDRVLVGEMQSNEYETDAIALAADNAYDSGVIFVSANGNSGPFPGTVDSPGKAHKVLAVGAFDVVNGEQYEDQSWGPAFDGRIKPDIQAPTRSETASSVSDTALHTHNATSGATPYAAGAAMLARNWLRRFGYFDNGQTYAFMILYGQNYWPYDNIEGAGPIKMATNGWAWWGKLAMTQDLNVDIPINVPAGKQNLDVALWWPESAPQAHNDIDVNLIDPNGVERATADSVESIFERTGVQGSLTPGVWTVRIRGASVPAGPQTVYWATTIRN